jgi:hypothetical protein
MGGVELVKLYTEVLMSQDELYEGGVCGYKPHLASRKFLNFERAVLTVQIALYRGKFSQKVLMTDKSVREIPRP